MIGGTVQTCKACLHTFVAVRLYPWENGGHYSQHLSNYNCWLGGPSTNEMTVCYRLYAFKSCDTTPPIDYGDGLPKSNSGK